MARKETREFQVIPGEGEIGLEEGRNSLEEIQDLLKSLPSSGEAYLKIYKTKPLPSGSRPQFMGEVSEIGLVEDLEIYLRNLAKENGWGSGEYLVSVIPKNRKTKAPPPVRLNINYDEDKVKPDAGEELKHKVGELKELITTIRELMGPTKDPGMNTTEVSKALSDSFKLGMETLKGIMPTQDENKLVSTITQLQNLGLFSQKGETLNQGDLILQMLKVVKEMGLLDKKEPPPPPDMFSQLGKLKEMGLIKVPGEGEKEDDPFSMFEKMRSLIELVKPLVGGMGESEKPTLGLELVRIVGPHVPKMVDRIASTVDNVAEVSKMRLSRSMGGAPPHLPPHRPPISPDNPPEEVLPDSQMHPAIREVYEAVESRNKGFFPKLRELIDIYVGPHIIPSLLGRTLEVESFLQSLSANLNQPFLLEEKSKLYFKEFLSSLSVREQSSMVIGKCGKCNTEYEFANLEEFDHSDKKCEDCGGELVTIPSSSEV